MLLDLPNVASVAEVWIDDAKAGQTEHGFGTVDLTAVVSPGKTHDLRVVVNALPGPGEGYFLQGETAEQVIRRAVKLDDLGLTGDVFLKSRPRGPHVADVFVKTSIREKAAELELDFNEVERTLPVKLTARMLDEQGDVEKQFEERIDVKPGADGPEVVRFDWADARLWDLDQPNLYTLDLTVTDVDSGKVVDHLQQRFGFREFWIDGKHFMLNGSRFNLRPNQYVATSSHTKEIDHRLRINRLIGFNISPTDGHLTGGSIRTGRVADRADQLGHPLIGWLPGMSKLMVSGQWANPDARMLWYRQMSDSMRRLKNHPSIFLWAHSANAFAHGQDQNPRYLGIPEMLDVRDEDPSWWKRAEPGMQANRLIKKLDPTRPAYAHNGSLVGDIQNTNMYLNFMPLQEREEWLSHWFEHGEVPFQAGEFGLPLDNTWTRGKAGGGWTSKTQGSYNSEPMVTQYMASYLGSEAYRLESEAYRASIPAKHKGGYVHQWSLSGEVKQDPGHHEVMRQFITNTARSWRTWGLSGGTVPWAVNGFSRELEDGDLEIDPFTPGQRGEAVTKIRKMHFYEMDPEVEQWLPPLQAWVENNQDTLAWIAGDDGSDDPASFTDKTHHYRSGQSVLKQAIIINDSRSEKAYEATWQVIREGQTLESGSSNGQLEPAAQTRIPIRIKAPEVDSNQDFEIVLSARIGEVNHEDRFAFTVFPKQSESADLTDATLNLKVHDPVGRTSEMLDHLGLESETQSTGGTLHVIGREALSANDSELSLSDYRAKVESGDVLLVMAQHPEVLRERFGFRVAPIMSRRVFATRPDHPVTAGLDADMLRDWAGTSTLIEPRPTYPVDPNEQGLRYYAGKPLHGWRWGNRHGLTSAPIEKPHLSGWQSILECEFDLAYSPLMELRIGKGRVILCTLDLEDHVEQDPAAELVARRLLAYVASPQATDDLPEPTQQVTYLGEASGQELLASLGLRFDAAEAGNLPADTELLILGPSHGLDDDTLASHLRSGRQVFALPLDAYPFDMETASVEAFSGAEQVPTLAVTRGMGISVFRRNVDHPMQVFQPTGDLQVAGDGMVAVKSKDGGLLVATQFDPRRYDTEAKPYFRYTQWRDTRGLVVTLANLGATFRGDAALFAGDQPSGLVALEGAWQAKLIEKLLPAKGPDDAHPDSGISNEAQAALDATGVQTNWQSVHVPSAIESYEGWGDVDGEFVVQRTFEVPDDMVGRPLVLQLGTVDDWDTVTINGQEVGSTGDEVEQWWNYNRRYDVSANVVQAGTNTLTVRVFDRFGGGGIMPSRFPLQLEDPETLAHQPVLYHPDYRTDFAYGDDPYRYYRW